LNRIQPTEDEISGYKEVSLPFVLYLWGWLWLWQQDQESSKHAERCIFSSLNSMYNFFYLAIITTPWLP